MSKQTELNSYISRLLGRLRLRTWILGAAVLTFTALATTIVLVLILNHYAFPATGVKSARLSLLFALAIVAAMGIVWPLIRLTTARAVRKAEVTYPEFEQRLTTFHERQQSCSDPFLELLAADTLSHTEQITASSIAPGSRLLAMAGVGLGCVATLIWMVTAKPGYMGYGASLLWAGEHKNEAPLYSMSVAPGNITVRRHSDLLITAHVSGLHPDRVQLFAHYQSAKGWEPVAMQQQPGAADTNYQFVLAGLPENVEYYVSAGPLNSQHYNIRVADLPSVKKIQVTYQFPKWTGMKPVRQEQTGDLRAIEGTDAQVEIEMDKPLASGRLALDNEKTVTLSSAGPNKYIGTVHMDKDGAYHVAGVDQGQPVRLSEDYFIATDKAEPPQVSITRPGGDYRASPIEEVMIGVQGADEFGLRDLHLHYSVNGGPDHDINMLKAQGVKNIDSSHTLPLEEFKLVPGDLVSMYATAKDGHAESRTNISFVQVDPFEREFSQSQQSGGGGGGGGGGQNNQTDMSKREKELIAATWKQQNDKNSTAKDAASIGQFLSEAQNKLRDQVMALSARMQSRDLSSANEEFNGFEKDMQQAAEAMTPSADKLKGMQWKDALPLEQKALQALLRAEATFRKIQVAFGQQGGGGGGGANSAGRDLASLFDLELDTEKNQYETAQNTSPADQRQKEIDDVLAKLDTLAKRQEEVAKQQKNPQQSFQERWQQEMLRREAEQLQRQMEQLAQNGQQNGSQQSGAQSGSQKSSGQQQQQNSSSNSPQSGSNSNSSGGSQDQRVQQALSRLRQANDAMKRNGGQQQNSEAARQAADRLQEAKDLLSANQQQMASSKLGSMSQEADRIAQEERAQSDRINHFASQPAVDPTNRESMESRIRERNQLAQERQLLSNDLSQLQGKLRESSRGMASNQPETAQKLNRALNEMDESDLDNRIQRTADWLRRGINPNSNGTETEIAQGLQKLSQQLREAQKSVGRGPPGQRPGPDSSGQNAALDQVRRLREQLQAMSSPTGNRRSQEQQGQRQANRNGQNSDGRNPGGQNQANDGSQQQTNQGGGQEQGQQRAGQQLSRNGSGQQPGENSFVGGNSGDIRRGGGGYADGAAWNNINTGNNTYGARGAMPPAPTGASGNPQDTEQTFRQQLSELGRLNQMVQGDPNLSKEVRDLTRRMQDLDPKRFPGNPAIVEQMHKEMLSSINRLEIELLNHGATGEARSGKPQSIPDGYQEAVADYYRRLSKPR
jgi:uncharacterized phage infection (PIP) family protein YhgE